MKAVIQRVTAARVSVGGETVGKIGRGLVVLLGVAQGDGEEACRKLAQKISRLRVFSDDSGKTNLSLGDVGGEILAISQFTLFADCSHGNRPGFFGAAPPEPAERLYELFCERLAEAGFPPQKGIFGADMKIDMAADGPFTVILEM